MFQLEKASDNIGVIATGIDVSKMSASDFQKLYQAWLEHSVLIVRNQHLTIEQFLGYGKKFGVIQPHRVRKTRHPDHPELTVMGQAKKKADGTLNESIYNRGVSWHTDGPWDDRLCKATQLLGLEIPSYGGDTLFANMYLGYESLPQHLKIRIETLKAQYVYGGRKKIGFDLLEAEDQLRLPTEYSLIRVHPETKQKSLYFNPFHILKIADISEADSDSLIDELTANMIATNSDYRHKWQVGDLITWDNRCTLHSATGGYPTNENRIHWRCTIMEK